MTLFLKYNDGSTRMMSAKNTKKLVKAFREDTAGTLINDLVCSGCSLETLGGNHLENTSADALEHEARGNFS